MDFPEKITINNEEFKSLGGKYYASRVGKVICVTFDEAGKIQKVDEIFKPSVKEG